MAGNHVYQPAQHACSQHAMLRVGIGKKHANEYFECYEMAHSHGHAINGPNDVPLTYARIRRWPARNLARNTGQAMPACEKQKARA